MSATPNEIQRYAETLAPEARRLAIRTGISQAEKQKRLNAAAGLIAHALAVLKLGE